MTHRIYLVPGFFGFTGLGALEYFSHVQARLAELAVRHGVDAVVMPTPTVPTASIRTRAAYLADYIRDTSDEDDPVVLIGHSTGGMDARMLASPGVDLGTIRDTEAIASRIRSVVTVSSPHYGTPIASFFLNLPSQKLLKLLSIATVYVLRFGHLPLSVMVELAGVLQLTSRRTRIRGTLVDLVLKQLLADFSTDARRDLEGFLEQVEDDQSLVPQLTPEGIDIFNAGVRDRAGVRYGCVITRARPPGLMSPTRVGLDSYAQATHVLYQAFYRLSAGLPRRYAPTLTIHQRDALQAAYGRPPRRVANDGLVPALSQVWGDVVFAATCDHLDVLGHFGDLTRQPPHYDWLATGSGFDRSSFDRLWAAVARYIFATSQS